MASVGGPVFFSNIYAYSNPNLIIPFIPSKMSIRSNGLNMIINKDMLMVFPMTTWLSQAIQLITSNTPKINIKLITIVFRTTYPMSYESHKLRNNFEFDGMTYTLYLE
jgi:hypothetical protein